MEAVSRSFYVVGADEARQEIFTDLNEALPMIHVGGPDVMLARYIRSGLIKSSAAAPGSGLILPDQSKDNDKWGSCVGLIVKKGPLAFKVGEYRRWYESEGHEADPPEIGDWVFFDPKHGQMFLIGERVCYLAYHQHIFLKLDRPDVLR